MKLLSDEVSARAASRGLHPVLRGGIKHPGPVAGLRPKRRPFATGESSSNVA